MIPQEKIEQAENVANDYKHWEESEAFKDGFYSGVRFAEAEMKQKPLKSAREYWITKFGESPKSDSDKLAVAMMAEYFEAQTKTRP